MARKRSVTVPPFRPVTKVWEPAFHWSVSEAAQSETTAAEVPEAVFVSRFGLSTAASICSSAAPRVVRTRIEAPVKIFR